ncbi:MAG: translation initiation factor 6, partial [candidate division Zixibacteria bacterium]|nr:translation initiation factor 6 [candidate division Zixibacteria bacterium]
MAIFLCSLFGSASIGVYSLVTDNMAIVPSQVSETKAKKLEEWLKVKVIRTTIGASVLVGALARANSNGIVLPHFMREEEIQ